MSINFVMVTGNLTRDAELRNTNTNGTPVLNFSVAVNDRRRNNSTGEWEDYPNFFDCSLFGTRAEKIAPYLKKGRRVAIEGKLRWSQWEDKETGKKRNSVSILVNEIEFMSSPRNDAQDGGSAGGYDEPAGNDYAADEDIPF